MEQSKKILLAQKACQIRMGVVEGVYHAHSGHPGGSLSIAELMAYLYCEELNVRPEEPHWEGRDRFVLSKGHCAPALYAALAMQGFFPAQELQTLRHTGAMLQGHPDMKHTPGVDMSTGSLGQGVSAACGMALAAKLQEKNYRVYTLLGDGELEEGQVWEAAMFAAHKKLDNLCLIVDNNNLQIDGCLDSVCSPYPIVEKFEAFGFHVLSIDAHDFDQIETALATAKTVKGQPTAIIAKSTKGKGVSFMENQAGWHGTAPNREQYEQACGELRDAMKQLGGNIDA